MTPQELKNSILQLAFQGKLVEQRPEEGTGEQLYQQIRAEKQRLINEGKLKKEKPLPEITENEKPFDIPNSWLWVHLDNIAVSELGKTLDKAKNTGDYQPYLCSINVYWSGIDLSKVKKARFEQDELPKYKLNKGDLLICEGGDVGRSAIWDSDDTMYYQNALHRVRFYGGINAYFYKYLFECYKGIGIIDAYSKGMTIKHLVQSALNAMWLPLPPLSEQKRIVAKIEELLPYIGRYEQAWSKLEELNNRFPTDLQKSILQMAIQGTLVEQLPEEGTGEELYHQIQAEKRRLIKEGKLKKEKPLPEITEEEIPFDIPDSWKWVRLNEICKLISDGTHKTPRYVERGIPFLSVKDISGGFIDFSKTKFITLEEHRQLTKRCKPERNDVLVCRIGTLGKAKKVDTDNEFSIFVSLGLVKPVIGELADYIELTINSGYGFSWIQRVKVGGGTHTYKINLNDLRLILIPLPPLAEQQRIVAKLEEILPLCEKLNEVG